MNDECPNCDSLDEQIAELADRLHIACELVWFWQSRATVAEASIVMAGRYMDQLDVVADRTVATAIGQLRLILDLGARP